MIDNNLEIPFKPEEIRVTDEQILKSFKCPICLELVIEPISCNNCGKTSCKNCIQTYYQTKNINASPCIFKCGGTGYRKMTNKEKEFIDFIKLKCRHRGCNQFIPYSDYNSHFQNCIYRIYQCDNENCDAIGPYYQIKEHIKQCPWREINCPQCQKKIIFNSKEDHIKRDCSETKVRCIFCSAEMKRIDYLKNHKSDNAMCLRNILLSCRIEKNEHEKKLKEQNKIIEDMKKLINKNLITVKENDEILESLKKENELLKKKNKENEKSIEEYKLFMKNGCNPFQNNNNPVIQPLIINNGIQKKQNQNLNLDINSISKNVLLKKRRRNINSNNNDN